MSACIRLATIAIVVAFSLAAFEEEARPKPETKEVPAPPEKAVSAVAKKWKISDLAERLKQPGAAGQHDVFWEMLKLCEDKEEARKDEHVAAVMEWLLFEVGLCSNKDTVEAAFTRLPALLPSIGARLLDKRLKDWLATVGGDFGGISPWQWPEFRKIDAGAMGAAVRRLRQTGPKHNPLARLWVAAALVAVDDAEGPQAFAAETVEVEKSHSLQSSAIIGRVLESLAQGGIKQALPLYADWAEREVVQMRAKDPPEVRAWEAFPLAQLYQLLGWPQPTQVWRNGKLAGKIDAKAEGTRTKEWLNKNLAALAWDPLRRRFVCDAPPPGMEALYAPARAVEKRYELKVLDSLAQPQAMDMSRLVGEVVSLMEKNAEAAKDAVVASFLLALLDQPSGRNLCQLQCRSLLLIHLPKLNPELGAQVLAKALKSALSDEEYYQPASLLNTDPQPDEELVRAACGALLSEYEKSYAEARTAGNIEAALHAAIQLFFVGGKPDPQEVVELIGKAPLTWVSGKQEGLLHRWMNEMFSAHRTGYLRLLLINAARDLDGYQPGKAYNHPLSRFQFICNWTQTGNGLPGTGPEMLAQCKEWLDKNESRLKWDREHSKFTGAPSPALEALARQAAVLERYGVKIDDALASTQAGRFQGEPDKALLEAVLKLGESNAAAAKDPEWVKAAVGIAASGRDFGSEFNYAGPEARLAKINQEAGAQLCAERLDKLLQSKLQGDKLTPQGLGSECFRGVDPGVIQMARLRLAPKYLKKFEEAKDATPLVRCALAIISLYLGANMDDAELVKVLTACGAGLTDPRAELNIQGWATAISQSGSTAGLRLVLLCVKARPEDRGPAASAFLSISGLQNTNRGQMFFSLMRRPEDVDYYLDWLKKDEQQIRWDAAMRRFVAPTFKPLYADQPMPGFPMRPMQERAVRPPRPPSEQPPKQEDNF
ncbi:MAG: hypothetical protein ABSE73_05925 [Planctomycetota bacterium]